MKRPLAVCGFGFLALSLAACLLPAGLLLPLAALAAVLFLAWLLWRRKAQNPRSAMGYLPLLLATAAAALCFRAGYDAAIVRPVASLAGSEAHATARVEDVSPGYGGDTVHATLSVQALDGQPVRSFTVEVKGIAEVEIGEVVEVPLSFYAFSDSRTVSYNGAKGRYVGARATDTPVHVGEDLTALCRLRLWRYAAGDSIRAKDLPQRLSSVLSAMAVGDRRYVSAATSEAYRMAGLSHLLVVSGLHLSILAGLVYAVFRALTKSRRAGSALAFAAVLFFMAFTGFTPSIVRSGVAALLVLLARIIYQKPDIFTSMGLAALLLCLQNPYAAVDTGLLLSFASTFGAIGGGTLAQRLQTRHDMKRLRADRGYATALHYRLSRMGWGIATAALVSTFVTLATLPVTIWISGGVSLLTVPMNVIAVPLLAPIIVCGL